MNTTKHVVLLTSNIFGRGFDSRRLHHSLIVKIQDTLRLAAASAYLVQFGSVYLQ